MNDLIAAATAARARAYVPYSNFAVGAAFRTGDGRVFAAANVENAAYPQGQCAEASAIGVMIAAGARRIVEVAVIGSSDGPCSPCGGCRQRLNEFATPDVLVHMCDRNGQPLTVTLGDLLPHAFGPSDLGIATAAPATALDRISTAAPGFAPAIGLILGSGLGAVAEAIVRVATIPYTDLPGFPEPGVQGHAGRLVLGHLAGVPVACLVGRVHLYEGVPPGAVHVLVRTLKGLGCRAVVLTNASGSLRSEVGPGELVMLSDHINMLGANPLVGRNDDAVGLRFPDMSEVYDKALRAVLAAAATREDIGLHEGVYLATLGPSFETPAEIRAFRALGADLVGMSTVPEAISARHCGLRVAAVSVVTNLAAGMTGNALSHEETLLEGAGAADRLARLLAAAAKDLADATS